MPDPKDQLRESLRALRGVWDELAPIAPQAPPESSVTFSADQKAAVEAAFSATVRPLIDQLVRERGTLFLRLAQATFWSGHFRRKARR